MDLSNLWLVSGVSLAVLMIAQVVTWVIGRRIGKVAVVDVIWGLGFVLVAVVALLVGEGDLTRRVVLAVLTGAWGLRLSWHIFTRSKGKGEDPRYEEMLQDSGPARTFLKVFALQGALQWFVSLPVQVSAASDATTGGWWMVLVAGGLLWALGLTFEAVGDAQLAAFKADADNKGKVMDRGLWSWTRHPNYFGDSAVWWGLFLIAASSWPGVLTVASPVVMTYFLVWGTGAKLLEKSMAQRPGYPEYQQRTSYFLPLPPRSGR
jgi:steroid 5-alpha reductase family enzyme